MAQGIPSSVGPLWDDLTSEVTWIHARWILYRQLYAEREKRIELLNETAAHFFYELQIILVDDIVLALSRLTDPERTGKRENAVLERLVRHEEIQKHPELAQELERLLETVKNACEPFRQIRNKRIAHRDLEVAVAGVRLPGVSRQMVEDALESIRDLMNPIQVLFLESETSYADFVSSDDGEALVAYLRLGKAYEEAVREGVISWKFIPTTKFHDA